MHVTDTDHVTDEMQKEATELFHDVIDDYAKASRGNDTFKAVAKAINDKWKAKNKGDWRCCVGVPGLNGKGDWR